MKTNSRSSGQLLLLQAEDGRSRGHQAELLSNARGGRRETGELHRQSSLRLMPPLFFSLWFSRQRRTSRRGGEPRGQWVLGSGVVALVAAASGRSKRRGSRAVAFGRSTSSLLFPVLHRTCFFLFLVHIWASPPMDSNGRSVRVCSSWQSSSNMPPVRIDDELLHQVIHVAVQGEDEQVTLNKKKEYDMLKA